MKVSPRPDGIRRIVILRRADGQHSFVEEALYGATLAGAPVSGPYEVYGEEVLWVERLTPVGGIDASAEDAQNDALLCYEEYRTLN